MPIIKHNRYSGIKIQSAIMAKIPDVGFVLGEKGGGEEEEEGQEDCKTGGL
jgi:hypothetical protein